MSELLRSLGAHERLAATGVAVVAASLLLPWYGVTFAGGLVKTPLGSFGWVEAAILLTLGGAALLLARSARGHALPRPLHTGTLVALAGGWVTVLVVYRIADRPDFGPIGSPVGLRYGVYVALGGAVLMALGGLRLRREELVADRARERSRATAVGGPTETETFTSPPG